MKKLAKTFGKNCCKDDQQRDNTQIDSKQMNLGSKWTQFTRWGIVTVTYKQGKDTPRP